MNRILCCIAGLFLLFTSCNQSDYKSIVHDPALYRQTVKKLNDIILENNFPPMIGSRNYVYANIAAYEVIAAGDAENFTSLAGQIKHLEGTPKPLDKSKVDYPFASLLAFCVVGNAVTFPEGSMNEYVAELKQKANDAGMPEDVFEASVKYADMVSKHILVWSTGDNYAKLRSASKYSVKDEAGRWIPTPPMYSQAIEPHWCEIRPMVLDSAAQIQPVAPPPYNMKDKESAFYKNAWEVKLIGDNLTQEQKHIADFWDDNPFRLNVVGHVSYATKKFSPGGHWMNIVGIANQNNKSDFNTTVSTYALASVALFDGFIACWEAKFKTNYVRPETVITKNLDQDWKPYIQTPPFPEYTSGHAVISAATAEVLTSAFGDNVAFRDTSTTAFGIPARSFKSFREAAMEAGMSRVYGGIHYANSCRVGTKQGEEIGRLVVKRLKLKKQEPKLTASN
jgi:hypothetical protein